MTDSSKWTGIGQYQDLIFVGLPMPALRWIRRRTKIRFLPVGFVRFGYLWWCDARGWEFGFGFRAKADEGQIPWRWYGCSIVDTAEAAFERGFWR